jgi:hypothetical protein
MSKFARAANCSIRLWRSNERLWKYSKEVAQPEAGKMKTQVVAQQDPLILTGLQPRASFILTGLQPGASASINLRNRFNGLLRL